MEVPEKVVNAIIKLMEGWKTRLEVTVDGKVLTNRTINIRKDFWQGDSYSPVGFCLTEVHVSVLIEEADGHTIGRTGEEKVKRTHSLFMDNLQIYQESHENFEVVNEMIMKASMNTGACYGVKKCAENAFRRGKMIKGEESAILEEKMDVLETPTKMTYTNFLDANRHMKSM